MSGCLTRITERLRNVLKTVPNPTVTSTGSVLGNANTKHCLPPLPSLHTVNRPPPGRSPHSSAHASYPHDFNPLAHPMPVFLPLSICSKHGHARLQPRYPPATIITITVPPGQKQNKTKQKLFYRRHSSSELNARYLDTYLSQYGSVLPPCYLKHRPDGTGADKVPIPLTHPACCPPALRGVKVGGGLNRAFFFMLCGGLILAFLRVERREPRVRPPTVGDPLRVATRCPPRF